MASLASRWILFGLMFSLISCSSLQKNSTVSQKTPPEKRVCVYIRGAFDVGSTSTRMKIAEVDRCLNKVTKVLLEREEKVAYKDDLLKSRSQQLSDKIMNEGEETLKKLKAEGDALNAQEYVTVGTSAFRDAKNGKSFFEKINLDLRINAQVVAQDEEAELGFFAASQSLQTTPENTVIWDIGGGSQQMIHYKGNNRFAVYEGKLASVSFKEYILKRVEKKNSNTPNPMNAYQIKVAIDYARQTALAKVKGDIRNFLFTQSDATVIGIGGVHAYSVRNQIDPTGQLEIYTKDQVEKTLQSKIGKRDEDLNDVKYAETQVSNLALVLGYMKALHIEKVHVLNVNLTDGLLLNYKYWTP